MDLVNPPGGGIESPGGIHIVRGKMRPTSLLTFAALTTSFLAASAGMASAQPAGEFPFGLEMTLEAPPKPGSKRIPNIEIGDKGEARIELWCKGGTGQFSVAGNTVIFVPGTIDNRACPPDRAQADDALVAALSAATTWARQGDYLTFSGGETLRFRLNTN
jgi:heat shock protein HslJ